MRAVFTSSCNNKKKGPNNLLGAIELQMTAHLVNHSSFLAKQRVGMLHCCLGVINRAEQTKIYSFSWVVSTHHNCFLYKPNFDHYSISLLC